MLDGSEPNTYDVLVTVEYETASGEDKYRSVWLENVEEDEMADLLELAVDEQGYTED
jgi:hypothetical protein